MSTFDATRKLIEKYRSITLRKIQNQFNRSNYYWDVTNGLTGFGSCTTCTLCIEVRNNCKLCIHGIHAKQLKEKVGAACTHRYTYRNIMVAKTPETLLKAFNKRADYLEKLLKRYEP